MRRLLSRQGAGRTKAKIERRRKDRFKRQRKGKVAILGNGRAWESYIPVSFQPFPNSLLQHPQKKSTSCLTEAHKHAHRPLALTPSPLPDWRRARQSTPAFLPGESQGQRSLEGYGPWGCKELDRTYQRNNTNNHCQTIASIILICTQSLPSKS